MCTQMQIGGRERLADVLVWGAIEGIVFPPLPLPGPSQGPPGVSWFLRKNILAPVTSEPGAGLFTLAGPPDSFTDVTYRHAGTERESEGARERRGEKERRRR